jgi:pimeloyl-ACP methyl ester carboxylesterase
MHCVERHPEWYHAYFGLGQMNAVEEYLRDGYSLSCSEAKKEHNASAVKELETYGPADRNLNQKVLFKSFITTGKWLDYYLGKQYGYDPDSGASLFFSSLWEAPEYHFYDFINTLSGYMSTQKKLINKVIAVNLQEQVPSVRVPVYMILGEWDFWLPYAKRYYDSIQAPQKEFFTIKNAGHMVRGDKPDETEGIIFEEIYECGK